MRVNAAEVKAVPGRKTDRVDAKWLACLTSEGHVKPGYVPDRATSFTSDVKIPIIWVLQAAVCSR